MFKLLTEEGKKKVKHEYVLRRFVVILMALTFISVLGVIGLFPSYVLSQARKSEVMERVRVMGNVELNEDDAHLQGWVQDLNSKLRVLDPDSDRDKPSLFVEEIIREGGAGIRLTRFSWMQRGEEVDLSISGIASDRQALIAFENRIRNSNSFHGVSLPLSNLAGDRNIEFQIRFSLARSEGN